MKRLKWLAKSTTKKYAIEFLSIFIAVLSAFALNNWSDARKENRAEEHILLEIKQGLIKDSLDIEGNVMGHDMGLDAVNSFRSLLLHNEPIIGDLDTQLVRLTRDFISIQNISGYETLKSRGLELIEDDALRTKIISLYEYDYNVLRKLEEEYNEMQYQENYFEEIAHILAPYMVFDEQGKLTSIHSMQLSAAEKNKLLIYLRKIEYNRNFIKEIYEGIDIKIRDVLADLEDY